MQEKLVHGGEGGGSLPNMGKAGRHKGIVSASRHLPGKPRLAVSHLSLVLYRLRTMHIIHFKIKIHYSPNCRTSPFMNLSTKIWFAPSLFVAETRLAEGLEPIAAKAANLHRVI